MMASTKMKLGVLKDGSPGAETAGKTISKEASPDSKCPICLDGFRNISYVDKCLHRFCFRCIQEWAKNKAECPLCKQPFSSIYHSIQSEHDFQQYRLRPTDTGSFGSLAGHRFRYRTTLTGDRRPDRRTSPPPDHGVMFEGLSGSVSQGNDRGFRRMVARLAARRRAQGEGRALRTLQDQEIIQFRRTLYRRGLRVRDVRDGGRSRDTSAEFFRGNPACLHRLVPWLKRELTVLYGTHGSLVNIVQHIVMSQITRYDMQDPAVLQELRPFLLSRTEHFLHEFQSFARSPFNMEAYDQNAAYDCPAPSAEDSGSDSSVITVSEDEVGLTGARAPATLSQTPWDDETPGPSYSTEPPPVFTVSVASSNSDSEEEAGPSAGPSAGPPAAADRVVAGEDNHSGSENDCMIVGFVKPTSERTPELVQLSSDTEEEEEVKEKETKKIPLVIRTQPQHIRFTSPPDSPSSHQSASPHRPTATDRNRPSLERRPTSPRRSSTNRRRKNSRDGERTRSESKRRDVSRNRDSSSRGHKRRSRSKDKRQSKETSSFYRHQTHLSHTHLSHKHHSYESSRSHTCTHYSNVRRSPETRDHSRAQSQGRSYAQDRSWSRERSRARPRDRSRSQERSISREHYRSRSQERSHAGSGERSHARSRECSISRERARSREHCRSRSRERSRVRPQDRSRARSASRSRSRRSRSRERRQTPLPSPSSIHRKSRHDKPGGKRKYKSLHLEPSGTEATEGPAEDRKKQSRGKRERKRERKRRSSRSPSVKIVYEGDSGEALLKKHQHKKKKHKKKSRRKRSRERRERKSPTVITINSESETDANETTSKRHGADDTNVTQNITDLRDDKAAPSPPGNTNAKTAANDAKDALSLNMNHSSTDANDSIDANDANSVIIPPTSPPESPQTSRTVPDSAEPEPEPLPSHAQYSGTRLRAPDSGHAMTTANSLRSDQNRD